MASIVRLFVEGSEQFVFAHELLEAMEKMRMDVKDIKEELLKMDKLETIDFRELIENFGEEMEKIEFEKTRIDRTNRIVMLNGGYCVPVAYFLLETLREAITRKCIFQANEHVALYSIIGNLGKTLSNRLKASRFIDINVANTVKKEFVDQLEKHLKSHLKHREQVREVGPNGFTVEDFERELYHLGLDETLGTFIKYHELIFVRQNMTKPHFDLDTNDMIKTLESFQLLVIALNVPDVYELLHNQYACGEIFAPCWYCARDLREQENSLKSETHPSTSESNNVDDEKTLKRKEKKKRQAEQRRQKKESEASEAKPETQKSSCDKCYRTSQYCESWKEKYRQEKIKTKAGEKRELKMEEEIRVLKEELASLKAEAHAKKVAEKKAKEEEKKEEEEEAVRYLTPSYKWSKLTSEMQGKLNELVAARDSIPTLQAKATRKAQQVMDKAKDVNNQKMAREELNKILQDFQVYCQSIQKNIEILRDQKFETLTSLPELPKFSNAFETAYNTIVNRELEEKECMICFEGMEELKETIKCNGCIRRYHKECAWDWSTKGRDQCPTCPLRLDFD